MGRKPILRVTDDDSRKFNLLLNTDYRQKVADMALLWGVSHTEAIRRSIDIAYSGGKTHTEANSDFSAIGLEGIIRNYRSYDFSSYLSRATYLKLYAHYFNDFWFNHKHDKVIEQRFKNPNLYTTIVFYVEHVRREPRIGISSASGYAELMDMALTIGNSAQHGGITVMRSNFHRSSPFILLTDDSSITAPLAVNSNVALIWNKDADNEMNLLNDQFSMHASLTSFYPTDPT